MVKIGTNIFAALWFAALLTAIVARLALPLHDDAPVGPRGREGCYWTDALVVFVECRETIADRALGFGLTWSYYMTLGLHWGVVVLIFMVTGRPEIGLLVAAVWLTSIVCAAVVAARFIMRLLRSGP